MNFDQAPDAAQLREFESAQSGLSSALSRLLVVVERYPELKATEAFRDLQAQLEGTENRITVARNRHIEAIKLFNNLVTDGKPQSSAFFSGCKKWIKDSLFIVRRDTRTIIFNPNTWNSLPIGHILLYG